MPALATALACLVVGIADGDTMSVRCDPTAGAPAETIKVRLAEVDAPEHHQPFGTRSRESLAAMCFKQRAEVRPIAAGGGLDKYGRTVAHVACDGRDAGIGQLRAGMAWVFDKYVIDRSLYRLQDEARAAHRGLWADAQPVAPWEWRRSRTLTPEHAP
jgi:endonuclease YncB( thermonuclease family)